MSKAVYVKREARKYVQWTIDKLIPGKTYIRWRGHDRLVLSVIGNKITVASNDDANCVLYVKPETLIDVRPDSADAEEPPKKRGRPRKNTNLVLTNS